MKYGSKGTLSAKEYEIIRQKNSLRGSAMFLKEETSADVKDRTERMAVIEQLKKFLDDYDKNVEILEQARKNDIGKEPGE